MKKLVKILIILLIAIVLLIVGLQTWIYFDSIKANKKLVVVKSYYESIYAVDEEGELYRVKFKNPRKLSGENLKRGQEIVIYWHGMINHFAPAEIGNVVKYKILKEESDIEIPEFAIKFCYNSTNNALMHVRNFTNTEIEFRILDINEIPYEYDFDYSIYKKQIVANSENEETKDSNVIEMENTTIIESYNPDGTYKNPWEEAKLIGRVEERYNNYTWNVVDSTYGHYDIEAKYDWTKLYGVLEPGEYRFILSLSNKIEAIDFSSIRINFVVDEDGKVTYESPSFEE